MRKYGMYNTYKYERNLVQKFHCVAATNNPAHFSQALHYYLFLPKWQMKPVILGVCTILDNTS